MMGVSMRIDTKMNGFGNFFQRFTLEYDYSLLPIWVIPSLLATSG